MIKKGTIIRRRTDGAKFFVTKTIRRLPNKNKFYISEGDNYRRKRKKKSSGDVGSGEIHNE